MYLVWGNRGGGMFDLSWNREVFCLQRDGGMSGLRVVVCCV